MLQNLVVTSRTVQINYSLSKQCVIIKHTAGAISTRDAKEEKQMEKNNPFYKAEFFSKFFI